MKTFFRWLVLVGLLLGGCSPAVPTVTDTPAPPLPTQALTPYSSPTPRATLTPGWSAGTPTPFPSPPPTPRVHTVTRGQDMGGIAFLYGITIETLMDANPDVDPRVMSVGTQLLIPAAAETSADVIPSPTPVGVLLGPLNCLRGRDEGAWCFIEVKNSQAADVESVALVVRAANNQTGDLISQTAYSPLNRIPAGQSLPLAVSFPPPLPAGLNFGVELLAALPVPADASRYLDVEMSDPQVEVEEGGKSAQVSVELRVLGGLPAREVRLAAGAYNALGEVVGLRTWQSGDSLEPGSVLPVKVNVYSSGGEIETVKVWAEARP